MCIGDWRLGRLIRTRQRSETLGSGATITLARNPQRVGVYIDCVVPTTIATTWPTVTINGTLFAIMSLTQSRLFLTLTEHGNLPTQEITLTQGSGAQLVAITEYFMPEKYLSAAEQEFYSKYAPGGVQ